jgi:hypothetical protein
MECTRKLGMVFSIIALLASSVVMAQPADATKGKQLTPMPVVGRWMSAVGCITSGIRYHQIAASDAATYGGSGFAFALNIGDKVGIPAPTDWDYHPCYKLAGNLGLTITDAGTETKDGRPKDLDDTWRRVTAAIDQNTPAFAWAMGVPEYYPIVGYDAEGNYLFPEFTNGGAMKKKPRTKLCEGWPLWVYTMAKGKPADEAKTAKEALQFALEFAAGRYVHSKEYHTGIAAYGAWIKSTAAGDSDPGGYAYNAQCWAECRQAAAAYLEEVASKTSDPDLKPLYDDAAQAYSVIGQELRAVADLFPYGDPARMRRNYAEETRRKEAIKHLQAARDAETQALAIVEQIVAK